MRGVAGDEGATIAKPVGDQAAAVPVFVRDDLVFEIGFHPEDGAQGCIAIDLVEIALAGLHVIVHQPAFAAIDRVDHARAPRVDGAGPPGALALLAVD